MQEAPKILTGQEDKFVFLAQTVVSNLFIAKTLSLVVDQAEYDGLASALVNISMVAGNTLAVIREIVSSEFEQNFRAPGSILRGNCVASKIMGAYSRIVGAEYLRECIGTLVKEIATDDNLSLEIDPVKIEGGSQAKQAKNIEELSNRSFALLTRITDPNMIVKMPKEIKAIAGFTAEYAKIYCADRLYPLIGGFIMLRLFNPSLVTPEAFGIIPDSVKLTPKARRNLTLITKLLQNLSNGILFGAKETYMTPMNKFIETHQAKMNDYLAKFATAAQNIVLEVDTSNTFKQVEFEQLKTKDLELLHQLLYNYKDKILEHVAVEVAKHRDHPFTEEENLFQILDELGAPKRKIKTRVGTDNMALSFPTPPEKSGHVMRKQTFTRIGLIVDTKRFWVVLTSGFLHFFHSAQETKPQKSISLDEILINMSGESDSNLGYCFSITYYRKDHLIFSQTAEEVSSWISSIRNVKEKYAKSTKSKVNETLRPIEVRIRNHTMGLKLAFDVSVSHNFECTPDGKILFILEIEVFSTTYTVTKTLADFKALHEKLMKEFPKIIFPTFPNQIGEETTAKLPLGKFNGRASFAVIVMIKFLRAYLHEIKSNLKLQQSEVFLDFLELMCPIKAVEHDRVAQLSRLLQMSVDFNKHDAEGLTALHRAVVLDRLDAIKWLINCSTVHINSKDNNGNTPLVLAIKLNKTNLATILIKSGAEVKLKNNIRSSPLHIAASMGMVEICELLIENGVKVDELNMKRKTPLHYAIYKKYPAVASLLLDKGASTDYKDIFNNNLISLATASKLDEIVDRLLTTTSINVNEQGRYKATALHFAAANGSITLTNKLLERGANPLIPDIYGNTTLFTSVTFGRADVLDILCDWCTKNGKLELEEEHDGNRMVHVATLSPAGPSLIPILAKYSANLNAQNNAGKTPLYLACQINNLPVIEALLKGGADPSLGDKNQRTPMYLVSYKGFDVACKLLIESKADINQVDLDGTSPLQAAVWGCQKKIVEILLANTADVNQAEIISGSTALHIAIEVNQFNIAATLLNHGANINTQRISDGNSPIQWCVENEFTSLACYLAGVEGIDLHCKNKQGETVLQMAAARNDAELLRILKSKKVTK